MTPTTPPPAAETLRALQAVAVAMLNGGDGEQGDFGWDITKLNLARPLIRAALAAPDDITCAGAGGDDQPVAWRWRYVRESGPDGWTHRGAPIDAYDAGPGFCSREVEPLYTRPARPEPVVDGDRPVTEVATELLLAEVNPAHAAQVRRGIRKIEDSTIDGAAVLRAICNALHFAPDPPADFFHAVRKMGPNGELIVVRAWPNGDWSVYDPASPTAPKVIEPAGVGGTCDQRCGFSSDIRRFEHSAACEAASRPAPEPVVDGAAEVLSWFSGQRRLSIDHYSPVYGDDDDQSVEWRVTRESGSINDREFDVIGRGETAIEAMIAARATLCPNHVDQPETGEPPANCSTDSAVLSCLSGFVADLTNKGRNRDTLLSIDHDKLRARIKEAKALLPTEARHD